MVKMSCFQKAEKTYGRFRGFEKAKRDVFYFGKVYIGDRNVQHWS